MRAIDTNVLVRLIVRDDARQTAAAEVFIANGAWVSLLGLIETIWVLRAVYGSLTEDQAKAVEILIDHRQLVLHEHESVFSCTPPIPNQAIAWLRGLHYVGANP